MAHFLINHRVNNFREEATLPTMRLAAGMGKANRWEPWSSGYGRRLMFQRRGFESPHCMALKNR